MDFFYCSSVCDWHTFNKSNLLSCLKKWLTVKFSSPENKTKIKLKIMESITRRSWECYRVLATRTSVNLTRSRVAIPRDNGEPKRSLSNKDAQRTASTCCRSSSLSFFLKGAITSKIKHAIKLKTSPASLAQLLQPSLAFCFSLQPMTAYRPVLDGTPSLAAS